MGETTTERIRKETRDILKSLKKVVLGDKKYKSYDDVIIFLLERYEDFKKLKRETFTKKNQEPEDKEDLKKVLENQKTIAKGILDLKTNI